MPFDDELNELLTDTFNVILKSEEKSLKRADGVPLSINEFHLIEAIAKNSRAQNTVSNLAAILGLSLPSVTIAVKKLEQKGFVEKARSAEDGRSAHISLTEKGVKTNEYHNKFHKIMVRAVAGQMTAEEKELLYRVVLKLNNYFKKLWHGEERNEF